MVKCRICKVEMAVDELGAHLLSVHAANPPSRLKLAGDELKSLNLVLHRLEKQGLSFADYAQGLRKLANILGVLMAEVASLQREVQGLGDDFGEHLEEAGEWEVWHNKTKPERVPSSPEVPA